MQTSITRPQSLDRVFCLLIIVWLGQTVLKLTDVEQMTRMAQAAEMCWILGLGFLGSLALLHARVRPWVMNVLLWGACLCMVGSIVILSAEFFWR